MEWIVISGFFLKNFEHILKVSIIFIIGLWIIKKSSKIITVFLSKSAINSEMVSFLETAIKFVLRFFLIVALLASFNINIISIITAVGASFVTFALIFKDNLSNFASGFFIILEKSIRIGDEIEIEDFKGTVTKIDLTFTLLKDKVGKNLIIPNTKLVSNIIKRTGQWDIVSVEFKYLLFDLKDIKNLESNIERYIIVSRNKILTTPQFEFKYSNCEEGTYFTFIVWTFRSSAKEVSKSLSSFLSSFFNKNSISIIDKEPINIL